MLTKELADEGAWQQGYSNEHRHCLGLVTCMLAHISCTRVPWQLALQCTILTTQNIDALYKIPEEKTSHGDARPWYAQMQYVLWLLQV
jgi:hypothetical protein